LPKNTGFSNLKHIFIAGGILFRLSCSVSKFGIFIKYWLPTLLWMALIFSASADSHSSEHSSLLFLPFLHWLDPNISDEMADKLHHLFRKCAHLTEYALLALLVLRSLNNTVRKGLPFWSWRRFGVVVGMVFLYASTDEFHQAFVPTRTPAFMDVLIDTAGGTAGLLLAWLWQGTGKNGRGRGWKARKPVRGIVKKQMG